MSGHLVMLEATYLTAAKKFSEARHQGRLNMRSRKEFDSLLDIQVRAHGKPAGDAASDHQRMTEPDMPQDDNQRSSFPSPSRGLG